MKRPDLKDKTMSMKEREGFTLIELLIVTIIFGMMTMSLAAIYSTANKHMFQGYRQNAIKSGASLAIKTISSRLTEATRIDSPSAGGSNELAFASNVDQLTGCYPVNPDEDVVWHKFCYIPGITAQCPQGNCLYYHTGTIQVIGGGKCPGGQVWGGGSVYPACGSGTVMRLASFVQPPAGGFLFSRDSTMGNTLVNVRLRVLWDPAASGQSKFSTARAIDTTLTTTAHVLCAGR